MILNGDGEKKKFYLSSCYYLNENVMGINEKKISLRKMCSFKKFAKKLFVFHFHISIFLVFEIDLIQRNSSKKSNILLHV